MDALSRHFALLRALLSRSRSAMVGALLATGAAVWSAFAGDADLRSTHEIFSAIALSCWLGSAAQRMPALAVWAGQLGIPGHAARLRKAQLVLLALSLASAVVLELQFAADLRTLAVPLAVATVVVSFASLPAFGVSMVVGLLIVQSISRDYLLLLFAPVGAILLIGICLPVIAHWFRQVRQLHERGAIFSESLADAAHEEVHAEDFARAQVSLVSSLGPALLSEPAGRVSARKFWLGMGYDPVSSWKATGYSLLMAIVLFAAAHFFFAGRLDRLVYLILSGLTAFTLFARFNGMHEAWLRTPHEQSVLTLSPRWPQGNAFKTEFLRSLWSGFPGYAVFWGVLSVFALALRWVEMRTVLMVGVGFLILTQASVGLMMYYLAQRRARRTSSFALCYAVLVLAGMGVIAGGWATGTAGAVFIGLALVVVPILPTVYLFWTRRLQFPVQPPPGPPA
jgi:hypothetical protein